MNLIRTCFVLFLVAPSAHGQRQPDAYIAVTSGKASTEPIYDASILEIRSQLHGIAHANLESEMRPAIAGVIREVHVHEGQWVDQDELLVQLNDDVARAAWKAAQAAAARKSSVDAALVEFQLVEKQLSRVRRAYDERASSEFELEEKSSERDQARAAYNVAREEYNAAQANLELATAELAKFALRAPFDGQVVRMDKKLGQPVDVSETVLMLVDARQLEVEMYVPIDLFGKIQQGQTYRLQAAAPVNAIIESTAKFVAPIVDSTSGTFRCVFSIDNRDLTLPVGFAVTLAESPDISR